MKVMQILRLRNLDHDTMRTGLATFEKHGVPGLEALWMSADSKTAVLIVEIDDPTQLHPYETLYAPYMEHIETHIVSDVVAGVAHMKAGLDLIP
jgi:hypothetical protein